VGFDVGVARVPIVAGAVIFDLGLGEGRVRPDADMGRAACLAARPAPPAQGNVGAGAGATVGKLYGLAHAMKGGFGTASEELAGGVIVGACAVVNAFGDVVDPRTGEILAGARDPQTGALADTAARMKQGQTSPGFARPARPALGSAEVSASAALLESTTLGVIATNARLTKVQANKVAQMAHHGLARALRPAHTFFDGDTVFVLATGDVDGDTNTVGLAAGDVLAEAIVHAVRAAHTVGAVVGLAEGNQAIRQSGPDLTGPSVPVAQLPNCLIS
jgi:L-aminopeptidase/D-esterase-like protein